MLCSCKDPGKYRPVSLTSVTGKMMREILLSATERPLKDSAIIRQSQHGFTKGETCLTNLISFYETVTLFVGERKVADIALLNFSEAFDTAIGSDTGQLFQYPGMKRVRPYRLPCM